MDRIGSVQHFASSRPFAALIGVAVGAVVPVALVLLGAEGPFEVGVLVLIAMTGALCGACLALMLQAMRR